MLRDTSHSRLVDADVAMERAVRIEADGKNVPRVAIIFVNYGPYHVARARALLRQRDIDPTFVELASTEQKYAWSADKQEIAANLATLSENPYETCSTASVVRSLKLTLDRITPSAIAVAGYSEPPMRAAARWARSHGAGIVLMGNSVQGTPPRRWWRELPKRLWISRNVDAGFAAGTASADYMAKLGIPQSRIWRPYNVVDNDFFRGRSAAIRSVATETRRRLGVPEHYFLFVGRLVPEKNLAKLLVGYQYYRDSVADPWSLVIVGDGPLARELMMEGPDGLIWAGWKSYAESTSYYALAEALVLPSESETWGNVVNEAMASSLPVIVSAKCGCAMDLVRNQVNGYVIEPEPEHIARSLATFAALPGETRTRMGAASLGIIEGYSPEMWARNLSSALQFAFRASRARG